MGFADTETAAVRALVAHLAREQGLRLRLESGRRRVRAVLESPEETFLVLARGGTGFLTLSVPLLVAEDFVRERLWEVVEVAAGYDVSVSPAEAGGEAEGEVTLSLSLRLYLAGLNGEVFRLALENLRAARGALRRAFP